MDKHRQHREEEEHDEVVLLAEFKGQNSSSALAPARTTTTTTAAASHSNSSRRRLTIDSGGDEESTSTANRDGSTTTTTTTWSSSLHVDAAAGLSSPAAALSSSSAHSRRTPRWQWNASAASKQGKDKSERKRGLLGFGRSTQDPRKQQQQQQQQPPSGLSSPGANEANPIVVVDDEQLQQPTSNSNSNSNTAPDLKSPKSKRWGWRGRGKEHHSKDSKRRGAHRSLDLNDDDDYSASVATKESQTSLQPVLPRNWLQDAELLSEVHKLSRQALATNNNNNNTTNNNNNNNKPQPQGPLSSASSSDNNNNNSIVVIDVDPPTPRPSTKEVPPTPKADNRSAAATARTQEQPVLEITDLTHQVDLDTNTDQTKPTTVIDVTAKQKEPPPRLRSTTPDPWNDLANPTQRVEVVLLVDDHDDDHDEHTDHTDQDPKESPRKTEIIVVDEPPLQDDNNVAPPQTDTSRATPTTVLQESPEHRTSLAVPDEPTQEQQEQEQQEQQDDAEVLPAELQPLSFPTTTSAFKEQSQDDVPRGGVQPTNGLPADSAEPPLESSTDRDETPGPAISSNPSNSFQLDRGGAAEDAELLAELRAISSRSSARFANESVQEEAPAVDSTEESTTALPPWKRKRKTTPQVSKEPTIDIVVAEPKRKPTSFTVTTEPPNQSSDEPLLADETTGYGIKSSLPNTFQGERGGAAEDADLLAELRAVSAKSRSAARFAEPDTEDAAPPAVPRSTTALPPWKQKTQKQVHKQTEPTIDIKVAPQKPAPPFTSLDETTGDGFKSPLPSTDQGERSGPAQDADLLAELQAISSQSSSAARFEEQPVETTEVLSTAQSTEPTTLPPWKQQRPVKPVEPVIDLVQETPKEPVDETTGYGLQSTLPNTFQGDRGGTAEDADLLAELRAVSARSSGTQRFQDDEDQNHEEMAAATKTPPRSGIPKPKPKTAAANPLRRRNQVGGAKSPSGPPMQESESQVDSSDTNESAAAVKNEIVDESVGYGIKSDFTSTFQGERGGAAEDAELLAALRAISTESSSASRFAAEEDLAEPSPDSIPKATASRINKNTTRSLPLAKELTVSRSAVPPPAPKSRLEAEPVESPSTPSISSAGPGDSGEEVTQQTLPSTLASKNWKIRLQSYELLNALLKEISGDDNGNGNVDAHIVLPDIDTVAVKMAEETNVGALDKALEFLITYANVSTSAGDATQASAIVSALVKKNGMSSRPSTSKLSHELTLKLIEVGKNGTESAHAIVEVLLGDGVTSKKLKVVQAAVTLIHEAVQAFGAGMLPLPSISSALPKILSHANEKVRETGLLILSDLCRAVGSKSAFQGVLEKMKKQQISKLDELLEEQPGPTAPTRPLRSMPSLAMGDSDNSQTPQAPTLLISVEELEAQRYAARPAVNLIEALAETEYTPASGMKKWSEKVAALTIVLATAGEKPYKLTQPSPASQYVPLISEMKKLLADTHFAVASKAMEVLGMMAEGVGEKLFPYLRPLFPLLLSLSKDKKLTKAVGATADSMFGNVLSFEHILDHEDALPDAVDEKKQKNALARSSSMAYLVRCVARSGTAGPRSVISVASAKNLLGLATLKLDDSDATVRKEAMDLIQALKGSGNSAIVNIVEKKIESLKTTHARVYKVLMGEGPSTPKAASPVKPTSPETNRQPVSKLQSPSARKSGPSKDGTNFVSKQKASPLRNEPDQQEKEESSSLSYDDALAYIEGIQIPLFAEPEDDGGIKEGIVSSKWLLRQNAIQALTAFVESYEATEDITSLSSSILVFVRKHTKEFKESNINIMKSLVMLFASICQYHQTNQVVLMPWAVSDAVKISVSKIADKKLSNLCKDLITSLCMVSPPHEVLVGCVRALKVAKAPAVHEELLRWFQSFCVNFGAVSIGNGVSDLIPWLIEEVGAPSPKVKKESTAAVGLMHKQLGPSFRALTLQLDKGSNTEVLEKCFASNPFDPSELTVERQCRTLVSKSMSRQEGPDSKGSVALDVPKADLFASLPEDTIRRLGSKEGKTAWKIRKEALDDVQAALRACTGLVNTSKMKGLIELARALRERLSDTQINLKPVAAKAIGDLLAKVDKSSQAKIGKVVFAPLINAGMNDIKKPMRDAAIESLRAGASTSELEGGIANQDSLEVLINAFVTEVNETALRSVGLSEILVFLQGYIDQLPNLLGISASPGSMLGEKFSLVLVECLASSKPEIRSAGMAILEAALEHNVVTLRSCRNATEKMKPAKQRSIEQMMLPLTKAGSHIPSPKAGSHIPSPKAGSHIPSPKAGSYIPSPKSEKDNFHSPTRHAPEQPRLVQPRSIASESAHSRRTTRSVPTDDARQHMIPNHSQRSMRSMRSNGTTGETSVPPEPSRHPLVGQSLSRGISKGFAWPEFPEEPHGTNLLNSLKKAWGAVLPQPSTIALFPGGGIKKQDDAMTGCELLQAAIDMDFLENKNTVQTQLEFIFKWISFVLCCKEATVGLQMLLALIQKLFNFLIKRNHEVTDEYVALLMPCILEKAGTAKGRFHDGFLELIDLLKDESLISTKNFGAIVCVLVFEHSNHAKARVVALNQCQACVAKVGLAGIGKKGVVAGSKSLSEEHILENRMAALDLMEEVLFRMNGDMKKLARICGPSLTSKARELLAERWLKRTSGRGQAILATNTPSRPDKSWTPQTSRTATHDELPALFLGELDSRQPSPDTFAYAFSSNVAPLSSKTSLDDVLDAALGDDHVEGSYESMDNVSESLRRPTDIPDSLGSAALLRERLRKIKEKTQPALEIAETSISDARQEYAGIIERVRLLLQKPTPLTTDDEDMMQTTDDLKMMHAALSHPGHDFEGSEYGDASALRSIILECIAELLDNIICVIRFSLHCFEDSINSRISIPLLSVALATLMALFRFPDISSRVGQDDLMLLIREMATILLDHRFSSQSPLDSATCAQMAKAINKAAVNAATGAARHTSFQALIALQQQLMSELNESLSDDALEFNGRLSRVISRLFARVIRAEEALDTSYSPEKMDMEALVCSLEDALNSSEMNGRNEDDACKEMVVSLVTSMKQHARMQLLETTMGKVGIAVTTSSLGLVIESLWQIEEPPPTSVAESQVNIPPPRNTPPKNPTPQGPSVADLVTSLGSSREGPQRNAALRSLQQYINVHGYQELNAHLQDLSPAFREFIEDLLSGGVKVTPRHPGLDQGASVSAMSERLQKLRSRLQATDLTVTTSPWDKMNEQVLLSPSKIGRGLPQPTTAARPSPVVARHSRLALPSPSKSKLPRPGSSQIARPSSLRESRSVESGGNSSAFQDRFSQRETRTVELSGGSTLQDRLMQRQMQSVSHPELPSYPSTGRSTAAEALRARLEAVKYGTKS